MSFKVPFDSLNRTSDAQESLRKQFVEHKCRREDVSDTVFATSSHGLILVSDRDANAQTGIVYAITNPKFAPGAAYTAALTSVGKLDFHTGVITPVVTGMVSPHGMAFIGRERER
jgi:hypothetical protein